MWHKAFSLIASLAFLVALLLSTRMQPATVAGFNPPHVPTIGVVHPPASALSKAFRGAVATQCPGKIPSHVLLSKSGCVVPIKRAFGEAWRMVHQPGNTWSVVGFVYED
ncbi:MAG: hypothetical protein ACXV2J_12210 [Actinomycetes bacterium]